MKYVSQYVAKLDHAPKILEIGSHEGKSACWMLDNFCNDEKAVFICVDPFFKTDSTSPVTEQTYDNFKNNISCNPNARKVLHYKDLSSNVLKLFSARADIDIIYIDGSHLEEDVYHDLQGSDIILRPGGLIVMDDVGYSEHGSVALALQRFLSSNKNYNVVVKEYQVILQKQ